MKPRISALINTYNEERNIEVSIRSLKSWVDEIIIVDMHSEDKTVEIAKSFGAKIFFFDKVDFVEPARNYGMSLATGDWLIILDADELIPFPLSQFLQSIAIENRADVISIPYLNYFFGDPLYFTGWGPNQDYHYRFFKPGYVIASDMIHSLLQPKADARVMQVRYQNGLAIVHFNYLDIAQFLDKMNRYTTIEARQAHESGEITKTGNALYLSIRGFFRRFFRQKGYKDGWRGFYLSLFWCFYRLVLFAKTTELQKVGNREAVANQYKKIASDFLEKYEQ